MAACVSAATEAGAVDPDEMLADKALEARAQALGGELRCVVCQSESIELSNAPLARDMRLLIRERIKAGDTDAEVKSFLVARYGDYVLMRPPFRPSTYILWWAPALALGAGAAAAYFVLRGQAKLGPPPDAEDDTVKS
ncbi:MAG: cytochrome c-type biogenesis protein CcmH [Parvularculaceae bacterium]|nr:cytochrome c-type biogenesis protein CcmH [Parvularculaceae bacterium]